MGLSFVLSCRFPLFSFSVLRVGLVLHGLRFERLVRRLLGVIQKEELIWEQICILVLIIMSHSLSSDSFSPSSEANSWILNCSYFVRQ